MESLTYQETSALQAELERLQTAAASEDGSLISGAAQFVENMSGSSGLKTLLVDQFTRLVGVMQRKDDDRAKTLARGAIAFLSRGVNPTGRVDGIRLRGCCYVTGFVVHQLRQTHRVHAGYRPAFLSNEQRSAAEDLLLDYYEAPTAADEVLLKAVESCTQRLAPFRGAGFFGRFIRNLERLAQLLGHPEEGDERRRWARAALSYLHAPDDVIPDDLGLVGLVDDAFVAGMAVEMIEGSGPPWLELLDDAVRAWPFLRELDFRAGPGPEVLPSEYAIVNASIARAALEARLHRPLGIVTPVLGAAPLLTTLLAWLGLLQDWLLTEGESALDFRQGQTVRVDNNQFAHFSGYEELNGHRYFRLRTWRRVRKYQPVGAERGDSGWAKNDFLLPVSHLGRLSPASARKRPAGTIDRHRATGKGRVSLIEHLFRLDRPAGNVADLPAILLVAPIGQVRHLASALQVGGHPLADAIPIAFARPDDSRDAESGWAFEPLSPRQPPDAHAVTVVGDLLDARDYVEEHPAVRLVVVACEGPNAGRTAAMSDLLEGDTPVVVFTTECQEAALDTLRGRDFLPWEWNSVDLQELLWPRDPVRRQSIPGEPELLAVPRSRVSLRTCPYPSLDRAWSELDALTRIARHQDSGDPPVALVEAIDRGRDVLFSLLRPGEVATQPCLADTESLFLSKQTVEHIGALRSAISDAIRERGEWLEEVRSELGTWRNSEPKGLILVSDRKSVGLSAWADFLCCETSRLASLTRWDRIIRPSAVVVGWAGRSWMHRLMVPPAAYRLTFLLTERESRWYEGLQTRRRAQRALRNAQEPREALFPGLPRPWKSSKSSTRPTGSKPAPAEVPHAAGAVKQLELLTWQEVDARRRLAILRVGGTPEDQTVAARLLCFTDGTYGFYALARQLVCVTELVRGAGADGGGVDVRTVESLQAEDVVLIPHRADQELLRQAADELLPDGTRKVAGLWRTALLEFRREGQVQTSDVWHLLRRHGCRRQEQTVRRWIDDEAMITPRDPEDIDRIAAVTGDNLLLSRVDQCKAAGRMLIGAHIKAARHLGEMLLREAAAQLKDGGGVTTLGRAGQVTIKTIESIDHQLIDVPSRLVNVVLDSVE